LALPVPALAQLALTTAGTAHYEYNSNVFQLASASELPVGLGGHGLGDSYYSEAGALNAAYTSGVQQFYATIDGDNVDYDRFTNLNHTDYTFNGGWVWKAGSIWDGVLDVDRIRSMVSFYNLIGTQLVLQTEQRETGKVGLQFLPDWRTEVTGVTRTIAQPQANAPNLSLEESSGQMAFKYTGAAGVTSGVTASYLSGRFSDVGGAFAPSYTQTSEGLTVADDISGLSTLHGELGYTSRSSSTGTDRVSGATGDLDYKRTLTGKTTAEVEFSRVISVYLTNSGSEIDDLASLKLNWQATYKTGVALVYTYMYRELPDQGDAPLGSERVDRLNIGELTVTYQPVEWLAIVPYFQYQGRNTTHFVDGDFSSNSAGIQFTVQWEKGVIPPRPPLPLP
jgi:hypothetical protein